jgi:phosphatidylinositol alpha-1,6-mannosyltransferase
MAAQPRVLLATPCFPPAFGGIERLSMRLVQHLRGVRLHVVASRGSADEPPPSLPSDVSAHWVRNEPRGGRVSTLRLNAAVVGSALRRRPKVVLALHIRTMPAARASALATGARTILVVHAKEMLEQPHLAAAAVRWADGVIVVSEHARALALAAGAVPERIALIHPGVDLPEQAPASLRSRPGPPRILTVARIDDDHKGHRALLDLLPRIREQVPDVRWTVVGEGRLLPSLRLRAQELDVADAVEFRGRVPDHERDALLRRSHAFVMLSQVPQTGAGEGFGMAFVEASAHGLPVVAGRVPGVVDAVRDGETGILVDPSDSRATVDAIVDVLAGGEGAERMAGRGRAWAAELSWPLTAERYAALIGTAAASPRRASRAANARWAVDLARGVPGFR